MRRSFTRAAKRCSSTVSQSVEEANPAKREHQNQRGEDCFDEKKMTVMWYILICSAVVVLLIRYGDSYSAFTHLSIWRHRNTRGKQYVVDDSSRYQRSSSFSFSCADSHPVH